MSESVQLFLPFSPAAPWVVRRDCALIGSYASVEEACAAARMFAVELAAKLGTPVTISVQDEYGRWAPDDGKGAPC